jgi:hypothetical protein
VASERGIAQTIYAFAWEQANKLTDECISGVETDKLTKLRSQFSALKLGIARTVITCIRLQIAYRVEGPGKDGQRT